MPDHSSHSGNRKRPNPIRRKPALDFSLTGLVYTMMMLFMGLAALNSQANLLFGVFGLMIGVLIVSGFISRMVLRKLEVRRVLPEYVIVGEPAPIQYEFTNRKRYWPSLSVTVGEITSAEFFSHQPQAYLLHAAARTTALVPTQIVPIRRGLHQFDKFQISTSFPFGFVKRAKDRSREEAILVYPPIGEVDRKLLAMCLSAEQSGARMKPRRGGTDEFYGVKEYRQGENPRWIYWRRSARTGTLVSKEMTQIAPPRILILLDTYVRDRSRQRLAEVERTIAMAASLVSRTIDQGLAVGLFVWSGDWTHVAPMRGKRHSRELLTLLACLPANTQHDRRALLAKGHKLIESAMTPILLTPTEVEQNLADQARSNWVVIAAESEQAKKWFTFGPGVDFELSVAEE